MYAKTQTNKKINAVCITASVGQIYYFHHFDYYCYCESSRELVSSAIFHRTDAENEKNTVLM